MIKFVRIVSFLIAAVIAVFSIFYIDAETELTKARQAYNSGDMDQALRLARRANFAFSDVEKKASAYYLQARTAAKMDWMQKSKTYLDDLIELDENNIRGLLFRGELAHLEGNNADALTDLNKGLMLAKGKISERDYAYSLSKRGMAYLELKQTAEAEFDARESVKIANELPEAHDLMSKVLEERGDIKQALDECETAYQLTIKKDKMLIFTPEGQELSDRLVALKVKYLQSK